MNGHNLNPITLHYSEPDENKYIEIIEKLRAQLYEVTKERRNLEDELSNITRPGR